MPSVGGPTKEEPCRSSIAGDARSSACCSRSGRRYPLLLPAEAGAWRVFNNVGIDSQHVGVCGDGVRLRVVTGGEGVGGVSGGTIVVDVTARHAVLTPPALPDGIVAHAELTPASRPSSSG